MSVVLQDSPEVLQLFNSEIKNFIELPKNHLLVTQMNITQISQFTHTIVQNICQSSIDTILNPNSKEFVVSFSSVAFIMAFYFIFLNNIL